MCQPATKRIVLAFLIYFMSKLNSWMKEIVSKRDLWSSYGTKSAAAGCKQAVNDDERCQSLAVVFLHKLFGNIDAITYFKPPYFTNRQILTPIGIHETFPPHQMVGKLYLTSCTSSSCQSLHNLRCEVEWSNGGHTFFTPAAWNSRTYTSRFPRSAEEAQVLCSTDFSIQEALRHPSFIR